jgi:hypothetical protein
MIDVANGGNLVSSKYQFTFYIGSSGAQYVAQPKTKLDEEK